MQNQKLYDTLPMIEHYATDNFYMTKKITKDRERVGAHGAQLKISDFGLWVISKGKNHLLLLF